MLNFIVNIFNDCAQNQDGKYDFGRMGAIIGCTAVLIYYSILIYERRAPDILDFAESYTSILTGAAIGVGLKNKMEK